MMTCMHNLSLFLKACLQTVTAFATAVGFLVILFAAWDVASWAVKILLR